MVRPETGLQRNSIIKLLEEKNIQTRLLFSGNILKHPCFDALRETEDYRVVGDLKETDRVMENAFWVGVYPGMTGDMLDYMIEVVHEAVQK